jgi:1,4-dihydroxy-2-naphthoyl-CoA hydrolase
MPDTPSIDSVAFLNEHLGGWNRAMGLTFTRVTADEVAAEVVVGEQHLQPYGLVHGGVHAGLIETACSTGAALHAMKSGQSVVGLENSTSFLRAAREGKLTVVAVPVARGRRTQVWEATVRDERGRALARGSVRLMCIEGGDVVAGKGLAYDRDGG